MGEKVMIGMSGGVDSTAAALILREKGYECIGATLQLFTQDVVDPYNDHVFSTVSDSEDARSASLRLGMPHYIFSEYSQFEECVIRPFINTYEAGGTPNPCIECNRHIKFSLMRLKARSMGCDYIATGHYARITQREDGRWLLKKGIDPDRDQSYVLYMLDQDTLAHTLMPLGEYYKSTVREIVEAAGLQNARKHDSQDICFIPDGDYEGFIRRFTGKSYPSGDFIDDSGHVLGRHHGIIAYTIGQRRGLGVSGGVPLYVKEKRAKENAIVLTGNEGLYSSVLYADDLNIIDRDDIEGELRCSAKIRYSHRESSCIVEKIGEDQIKVTFDMPQRAITAGQAVVLYDQDLVIGGGTIVGIEPID